MFAHSNPKRVAIIGGGEGATLREVLKHRSLETVVMIEIDEMMVKESAKHLYPKWNGCGDFVGSTDSCFDDPRADVRYEDALAWFMNKFTDENVNDEEVVKEKFDVIIMDALDPEDTVAFADVLYQNDVFMKSIYNGLNDDGILIAQLGGSPVLVDPPEEVSADKNRASMRRQIVGLGYQSMHSYSEHNCGFEASWTYLVACKDAKCRSNWYKNPAQVDESIHRRILRSKSGKSLLEYFDGTTMASYHIPRRAVETVYCRQFNQPEECRFGTEGWSQRVLGTGDGQVAVVGQDDLAVTVSDDGEVESVVAKRDIPSLSYIESGEVLRIPAQVETMMNLYKDFHDYSPITNFIEKSGMSLEDMEQKGGMYISSGVQALVKNTDSESGANIGHMSTWVSLLKSQNNSTQAQCESSSGGAPEGAGTLRISPESPVMARKLPHFESAYLLSLRDIAKGEEIMKKPGH
mmetsp:Transcript_12738/g.16093  ORF Transcript_12738/g.16093 Transcript_12738/m.16093 type:complete len:463 (+) Transcript_12738:1555-2943(+)